MSIAIGIDPSLTRTAVAVITPGVRQVWSLPTKGVKDATLTDRALRLTMIERFVSDILGSDTLDEWGLAPPVVLIEAPAHNQTSGSHHDRSGLWWMLINCCVDLGYRAPVEVSPQQLKMYATGKGNAGKDEIILAASRRYGAAFPATNNDEADAFILACMGARHLGHPVEDSLPQAHLRALDKIRWPEVP